MPAPGGLKTLSAMPKSYFHAGARTTIHTQSPSLGGGCRQIAVRQLELAAGIPDDHPGRIVGRHGWQRIQRIAVAPHLSPRPAHHRRSVSARGHQLVENAL